MIRNKNIKGKYHVRTMLKDVFSFAQDKEKTTYGLGYRLTLSKKKELGVLGKTAGIADA